MRYQQITDPLTEPVTLAEVKDHLRITDESEDAYLGSLIIAARYAVESHIGLFLISREMDVYLNGWAMQKSSLWWDGIMQGAWVNIQNREGYLPLPVKPVSAVEDIYLRAADNSEKTWDRSAYYLQSGSSPKIYKGRTISWPSLAVDGDAIRIRLTAGFGDSWNAVPGVIRQALLQLVAYLHANRGDMPSHALSDSGIRSLLAPYREAQI